MWLLTVALIAARWLLLSLTPEIPLRGERSAIDYLFEVLLFAFPTVGAVVASRRPENAIGWIFCAAGFVFAFQPFSEAYADYALYAPSGSLTGVELAAWISQWIAFPTVLPATVFLFLLFPDGRLPSRRWQPVAWAAVGGSVMLALGTSLTPGPLPGHPSVVNPFGIGGLIGGMIPAHRFLGALAEIGMLLCLLSLFVSVISPILRLRRSRGEQRQQLKWFVYAATLTVLGFSGILLSLMGIYFTSGPLNTIVWYLGPLALTLLPVAAGVAILRYRLYDIDLIINRTLVYGALTASVVGLYVLVVGWASALLQARSSFVVSLLATGLVAVLFQPLRDRLQRGVNRLMYGERDDPYAVLSRLGRRLEATLAPEEALRTVAEAVAQTLKLPYAAIELRRDGAFETVAEHGTLTRDTLVLPLAHQGEEVGRLVVATRAPGEEFTPTDRQLLEDLARQAGAAAHAARLTNDLQRSRERLVSTREEERRRLRRDLHDGLGPTLGGLTLGLDAARSTLIRDPGAADALLSELKGQTQDAVSDIRRLVYGLRPPALDDLGLVAAIRQHAAKHGHINGLAAGAGEPGREDGLAFAVEMEGLPPLPAAVEVAAYRIAQEAIANAARHSRGHDCRIRLSVNAARDELELEIADDGTGIPEGRRAGVGMSSMRERAEELGGTLAVEPNDGGGTRVLARLPLPRKEE